MLLHNRRILNTAKRLLILLVCFLVITSWTLIYKHLHNLLYDAGNNLPVSNSEYISDVKSIRCYSMWKDCNFIWDYNREDDLVTWTRVDKEKKLDNFIERGFGWKRYLYMLPDHSGNRPVVVDLAMGINGLPLDLINERHNKIKNNDNNGYHVHSNADYNFVGSDDSQGTHLKWKSKYGNHLEDWYWNGNGIWCKYGPRNHAVKNIKTFIGDDFIESRPFWKEMVHCLPREGNYKPISISFEKETLSDEKSHGNIASASLTMHRSDFKILQISDLHYGREVISNINDENFESAFHFDSPNIQFMQSAIRHERPDLVVLTGHLFEDLSLPVDYETQILKITSPIINNGIPYLFSWGESSDQTSKDVIMEFIKSLPFCMNKFDENNTTNLVISLLSPQDEKRIGTIFAFDSNVTESYNFLKRNSIPSESSFNLAFQHFPLQEYRPRGSFALIGQYEEKGPLSYLPSTKYFRNLLGEREIKAFSCGHEHGNDCCILSDGREQELVNNMWLCYGGVAGYDPVYDSKVRLFKLDIERKEITSWKRTIKDPTKVFDYQYIWRKEVESKA